MLIYRIIGCCQELIIFNFYGFNYANLRGERGDERKHQIKKDFQSLKDSVKLDQC